MGAAVNHKQQLARDERVHAQRDRVISIDDLCREITLGKSRIYEMVRDGEFPCPIQLSKGRVGWRESEVDDWIASRPTVDLRRPSPVKAEEAA